jgi:hypothetical protein
VGKNPAFLYYPSDFDRDTSTLSLSGTGAWIKLLNKMWFAQNRGELTFPLIGYARMLGATVEQTVAAFNELITAQVCDVFFDQLRTRQCTALHVTDCNENVTIVNRRMDREERARKLGALRVAKFRNAKSNATVTVPSSSSFSSVNTNVFTGHQVPAAPWAPSAKSARTQERADVPEELRFLRKLTRRFPPKDLWPEILRVVQGKPEEVIARAYTEWRKRHYSPENFGWLDWIEQDSIPTRGGEAQHRAAPCADCQQKAEWRLAHWLTFSTEEDFKQHLLLTWPPDEAQQKFVDNVKWWRTKRKLQDQERDRD